MRFSEWLKRKLVEALDPELDSLKAQEKKLLASMEARKDPMGRVLGINKAGYADAAKMLGEIRAKIKAKEGSAKSGSLPAWMHGRRAV